MLTGLSGCYMSGATRNCCLSTSLQCLFIRSLVRSVRVWLAVTCDQHFWQNGRDLSRAAALTRGRNKKKREREKTQKADPAEENSPAAPSRKSNPGPFDHESSAAFYR